MHLLTGRALLIIPDVFIALIYLLNLGNSINLLEIYWISWEDDIYFKGICEL